MDVAEIKEGADFRLTIMSATPNSPDVQDILRFLGQQLPGQEIQKDYRVKTVHANMCMYGMTSEDEEGIAPVKKDTAFMTNAIKISEKLERKCNRLHRHVHLMSGRAKGAQVHPPALCKAICWTKRSWTGGHGKIPV